MAVPIFQVPQQPQFEAGVADENPDVLFGGEVERVLERFMVVTIHQAYGSGIVAILSLFECAFDHPEWVSPVADQLQRCGISGQLLLEHVQVLDLGYRALGDD